MARAREASISGEKPLLKATERDTETLILDSHNQGDAATFCRTDLEVACCFHQGQSAVQRLDNPGRRTSPLKIYMKILLTK